MSSLGYKHTPEAKRRIGEASRGKTCPEGCKCWKHSEKTRLKRSVAATGRRVSAETRAKLATGGRKCSPDCTCGRHTVSAETRRKLSESYKNRTPEQEERRLQALRDKVVGNKWAVGVVFSEEERKRRSALSKKMWEDGVFDHKHPCWGKRGIHAGVKMACLNSEGVFARDCDEAGIAWQYEPRRFKLSWCTYRPDFYLPEFDIWVEVKGYPEQPGEWRDKIQSFRRETGKTLTVIFQKELSSLVYDLGGG